jgi:transcriptional regulator with XRE-family HTH domain
MNQIWQKIRFFRLFRGLKQCEVAELLEIDIKTYQNYENGNTDISYSRLCQLARIFNVPIYDLVGIGEKGYAFTIKDENL